MAVLLSVATVFADNSWNGYHWTGDDLSPTVSDGTKSSPYDVTAGVQEWARTGNGYSTSN